LDLAGPLVQRRELDGRVLRALYRHRARALAQAKDLEAALADLDEVVKREPPGSPSLARSHRERGLLLHAAGRHKEALAAYEAALALRPRDPPTRRLCAEVQLKLGRHAQAAKSYDLYLEHGGAPTAAVHRGRALARTRLGDHEGAIADCTRALGLAPDDV